VACGIIDVLAAATYSISILLESQGGTETETYTSSGPFLFLFSAPQVTPVTRGKETAQKLPLLVLLSGLCSE